jgi:hypothetical protein
MVGEDDGNPLLESAPKARRGYRNQALVIYWQGGESVPTPHIAMHLDRGPTLP